MMMTSNKARQRPRASDLQLRPTTGPFSLPSWVQSLIIVVGSGWVQSFIIVVVSVVITFLLVRENLDARWGIVDDHEIRLFLGEDHQARLGEFGPLLMSTEIGRIGGTATRFRPSYYSMRIAETIAWGDSPKLWYIARMAMMALSVGLFWQALAWWCRLPAAGLFVLYCLTLSCWGDIWCRLGPSETYCVPGTALFTFAMAGLWRRLKAPRPVGRWSDVGWWVAATVGAMVAMGSKESFVLLLLPAWVVAGALIRARRMSLPSMLLVGLMSAYGLLIAVVTVVILNRTGRDVYEQTVGTGRLALSGQAIAYVFRQATRWHAGALPVIAALLLVWRARWRQFLRPLIVLGVQALCLLALLVTQFVLYNGDWPPMARRYGFPGLLAGPLLWAAWAACVWQMLRIAEVRLPVRAFAYVAALVVLGLLTFRTGFVPLRNHCQHNAKVTRIATGRFDRAAEILSKDPDRPVLVVCHSPRDFEPAVSVARFLNSMSVRNPLFLRMNWRVGQLDLSPLDRRCEKNLHEYSLKGERGFRPWSEFRPEGGFYSIGLSGSTDGLGRSLGQFW